MIEIVDNKCRKDFDKLAPHPLQSWAWGEFRETLGQRVIRLGRFSNGKLLEVYETSIHRLPHTPWTVGYCPRGVMPTKEMVGAIKKEAQKYNCIFVKFEPDNIIKEEGRRKKEEGLGDLGLRQGKALFTPFTFQVDLTKSEEELLAGMKPKTRYNIKLAEKKGVVVEEDNSDEALEEFQKLTEETTRRQKFFAHNRRYRYLMWQTMRKAGFAKLLVARYTPNVIPSDPPAGGESRDLALASKKGEILATWVIFIFNGVGYYPYGASSSEHRDLMASNLLAWRALQLAKETGCKKFDFWGSLGPDPDINDPWYGFHRFKEGYGGKLVEFVGSWDLILKPVHYVLYHIADQIRWLWLRK